MFADASAVPDRPERRFLRPGLLRSRKLRDLLHADRHGRGPAVRWIVGEEISPDGIVQQILDERQVTRGTDIFVADSRGVLSPIPTEPSWSERRTGTVGSLTFLPQVRTALDRGSG